MPKVSPSVIATYYILIFGRQAASVLFRSISKLVKLSIKYGLRNQTDNNICLLKTLLFTNLEL